MKAHLSSCITLCAISLMMTGCLKTRAQLKENSDDTAPAAKGTPATVQEVQPQGAYVIDEIKAEMTRLNGRIEDLERAQKDAQAGAAADKATKDEIKKLETRIAELETAQASMIEQLKKLQETPKAPADPAEAYGQGKTQYDAGNFEAAIESFNAYLKTNHTKYVEDATYLRAEAYYSLKQYKKAIIDYSKFPEKYTKSKFMPNALYKIGLSFEALGMKEDAKGFYQELIEKFPKSAEAKKVRSKVK